MSQTNKSAFRLQQEDLERHKTLRWLNKKQVIKIIHDELELIKRIRKAKREVESWDFGYTISWEQFLKTKLANKK